MSDPIEHSPNAFLIPPEARMGVISCRHDWQTVCETRCAKCGIREQGWADEQATSVEGETTTSGSGVAGSGDVSAASRVDGADREVISRLRALEQRMRALTVWPYFRDVVDSVDLVQAWADELAALCAELEHP